MSAGAARYVCPQDNTGDCSVAHCAECRTCAYHCKGHPPKSGAARHVKSDRQRRHELLDVMCRLLHYQQHGDGTTLESPFAQVAAAWNGELPPEILARYRNDPKFHAQVQRGVALILEVMR